MTALFTDSSEHPDRLEGFLAATKSLSWEPKDRFASLDAIHDALNELAQQEVMFYYRARKSQRWVSAATRAGTLLLGSAGLLAPLIAAADPERYRFVGQWGYVFLAGAAAILASNRLFGGTGGHIRYVQAQYELESRLTHMRLEWQEWRATNATVAVESLPIQTAFSIFRKFADSMYELIEDETSSWGKGVTSALEEYAKSLPSGKSSSRRK